MLNDLLDKRKAISVIGLGYVGLPLALAFARKFRVVGFDINAARIDMMRRHQDPSAELDESDFEGCDILFTHDQEDLRQAHFHIVAVPTPVDNAKVPDLTPVLSASRTVGSILKKGDYVVYESTVYPGCTEEDCLPILEDLSGLSLGRDFKLGYSPERINPGDKEHTITKILKIVSGSDEEALDAIAGTYGAIIEAGIYRAASIRVAEAAKVIENTQRDINISLMNELSIIFDKMGIDTREVLEAAGTKWNFLKFVPGLVGGHCIGVDPYYLVHKSRKLGYEPRVILSGRSINDGMPAHIASRLVQKLIKRGKSPAQARVLVMGVTFKENVSDIRNSKVVDLIRELMQFSVNVHAVDPYASPNEFAHEYGLTLMDAPGGAYDAVVVAVNHREFLRHDITHFRSLMREDALLLDLKGIYSPEAVREQGMAYWRL